MSINSSETENKNETPWILFSISETRWLFIYYILGILFSFFVLCILVIFNYEFDCGALDAKSIEMAKLVLLSFFSGVLGSTVYYVRKLYKACIRNLVFDPDIHVKNEEEDTPFRKLGAKMYFYIRPLTSGILAVLINLGIQCGFHVIDSSFNLSEEKIFLFVVVVSFYIGFCNGKIIVKMSEQGESFVNSVFGDDNKK